LTGTIIGTSGSWGNNPATTKEAAMDGSLTTFYDSLHTGDWVGLDLGTARVITQVKYCPRSGYEFRMVGGQFQGSNVADFSSGVVTLFTFTAAPTYGALTTQAISNTTPFRYVRYLGPTAYNCNVAEVEFYGNIAAIAGRYIFYNNSKFDATSDSGAIATDKQSLLPGQTPTFANYTSYSRGIDGIIVDIKGLANAGALAASDFQFQVGNGAGWTAAPDPIGVSAPGGGGAGSSDRVTIIWADNVIQNEWLKVTVKATSNTGLSAADVFYFGNAIGESGNSATDAVVDSADETASRTHKTGFSAAAIDNHYDYNRDGRVNATDDLIARSNPSGSNPLQLAGAPLSAGETLQPLLTGDTLQSSSAVEDAAIAQSAAETATAQSETLETATLPPAAFLEDSAKSQTAVMSVENTISGPSMPPEEQSPSNLEMPLAAESVPALPASVPLLACPTVPDIASVRLFRPAPLLAYPAVLNFASPPISCAAVQFPGVLHPRDIAEKTILFSASLDAGASDQWVPTPERGNQTSIVERGNQTSRLAPSQDRLHDAVFARSARFSLTEEDGQPADSSAPADIETYLNDCLPAKFGKSPAHAIDNVFAALRRKNE
jgi:hypothetical protein